MIITESQLKQIIREELEAYLIEEGMMDWAREKGRKVGATAGLVAALMGPASALAQPATSPTSVTAQAEESTTANVKKAVENVRKQLSEKFKSPQSVETFVKFTRESGSPTFEDKTDDQIKEYYSKNILPKLLDVVKNVSVYNTTEHRGQIPSKVAQEFADDPQVGGLYHTETNAIWMNPQSFERTRQTDIETITASVLEEFFHAVDSNTTAGDLFPSLAGKPQAKIQYATSDVLKRRLMSDIIKPEAKGEYVAKQQEFLAKMQVIKTQLQKKHPDFFNESGEVDLEKLKNLIERPRLFFKTGEIDFRIFDVMKDDAGESVKKYFDQVAKADQKLPSWAHIA